MMRMSRLKHYFGSILRFDYRPMSAQVYEQVLDITLPVVDAVPVEGQYWPNLRLSGREEVREVPVFVLENGLVRFKIAPTLGGRVVEIHDKRTRLDVLPGGSFSIKEGGLRGVMGVFGGDFELFGQGRGNGLGVVEGVSQEPLEDDSPAAVFLHELAVPSGLGWTACLTLYPDRADLVVDLRVQNRTMSVIPVQPGMTFWCGEGIRPVEGSPNHYYDVDRDAGFGFEWLEGWCASEIAEPGQVRLFAPGAGAGLGPRRVESMKFRLIPWSGLGKCDVAGGRAAAGLGSKLKVQVPENLIAGKMFLKTADGQTFEAPADLTPLEMSVSDVSSLPSEAVGFLLRDFAKDEVLSFDRTVTRIEQQLEGPVPLRGLSERASESWTDLWMRFLKGDEADFRPFAHAAGFEHVGHIGLAVQAIRLGDWTGADRSLAAAVSTNDQDAFVWWLRAAVSRNAGLVKADEERADLMNAHYLDPMEPLLRAEALLSSDLTEMREPSPLSRPFFENPESALEVACMLLECGLLEDMYRFGDEVLRHGEVPGLRELMAYALRRHSRMEAAAAEHSAAAKKGSVRLMPWRTVQLLAAGDPG